MQEIKDLLEATFKLLEIYDLHANQPNVDY
jgi:hypothetical protein